MNSMFGNLLKIVLGILSMILIIVGVLYIDRVWSIVIIVLGLIGMAYLVYTLIKCTFAEPGLVLDTEKTILYNNIKLLSSGLANANKLYGDSCKLPTGCDPLALNVPIDYIKKAFYPLKDNSDKSNSRYKSIYDTLWQKLNDISNSKNSKQLLQDTIVYVNDLPKTIK